MRVRPAVLETIADHARRAAPDECCGLLIGIPSEILEAVETGNVAADPRRHYEVSPADYFAQIKRCRALPRAGGEPVAVVGVYHSHPRSAPVPSPTDREQAFGDFLYLIAGPVGDATVQAIQAYMWFEGAFQEVPLAPGSEQTAGGSVGG